ncbi:MAG: hypothetical protein JWO44_951 [Bacteroidetes bacterium]|nr:hypothetical protein [Bacteroidota bacterium]
MQPFLLLIFNQVAIFLMKLGPVLACGANLILLVKKLNTLYRRY